MNESVPDFEMFSEAGNRCVNAILKRAVAESRSWTWAYQRLEELSADPRYGEATDTAVRENLYIRLQQATGKEEGFRT